MTDRRRRVALCIVSLAFAWPACTSEVDPSFEHGRVDTYCGAADLPVIRIDLSSSALSCDDEPGAGGSRTLTMHAGRRLDEGTDSIRFEVASGESCLDDDCVDVLGGWLEMGVTDVESAAEITYAIELADGTTADGTATLPVCQGPCV